MKTCGALPKKGQVIVGSFWGIWWITIGRHSGFAGYPWPVWITLFWGIGLAFHYFGAYQIG